MEVRNSLAQWRAKRGLGASQLAAEAGISRPTIYAIEAGTYLPNTSVSLKLARILGTTVEELFQLEPEGQASAETAEVFVLGDAESMPPGQPLRLCTVNRHVVAVPAGARRLGAAVHGCHSARAHSWRKARRQRESRDPWQQLGKPGPHPDRRL